MTAVPSHCVTDHDKIVLWLVGGCIPSIPNGVSAPVRAIFGAKLPILLFTPGSRKKVLVQC